MTPDQKEALSPREPLVGELDRAMAETCVNHMKGAHEPFSMLGESKAEARSTPRNGNTCCCGSDDCPKIAAILLHYLLHTGV